MTWIEIVIGFIIAFAFIVIFIGWEMSAEENKEDIANRVVKKIKESKQGEIK